jgi:hypothetical protein
MKICCKFGFLIVATGILLANCNGASQQQFSLLNTSHLENLSEPIYFLGDSVKIVHIYADYPDYHWAEAAGEGIACIDDVARAAVFYLRHFKYSGHESSLTTARAHLDFILKMQAENGLFFNFIYANRTINKTRSNSVPKADWWAWRAVWALAEGASIFQDVDAEYSQELKSRIENTFPAVDSLLQKYPQTEENAGLMQPAWLPYGTAADQAGMLAVGLSIYNEMAEDTTVASRIRKLDEGLLRMQAGDSTRSPFGAFLSFQNTWHAWGNSQAYALFKTAGMLDRLDFTLAAEKEAKYFYPYLVRQNYLSQFEIEKSEDRINRTSQAQFPQIAYGIRPLVWANLAAFKATGQRAFAEQAGQIACWLLGKNIAGKPLYDPETGICFDGIESDSKINKNSGAESTIEALLTLLEVENNPIAKSILHKYYKAHHSVRED